MGKWMQYTHRGRAAAGGTTINVPGEFDYTLNHAGVTYNLTSGDLSGFGYWQGLCVVEGVGTYAISDPTPVTDDVHFDAGDVEGWETGANIDMYGRWCNADGSVVGAPWDVQGAPVPA